MEDNRKEKEFYTINEVAAITGLTTRTLRNYLKLGCLNGEKVEGVWLFTAEDLGAFFADKNVRASIQAKKNAMVFDFMADRYKKENEICSILDFNAGSAEADEISKTFCDIVNNGNYGGGIQFSFEWEGTQARVILKGHAERVMSVLQEYYQCK